MQITIDSEFKRLIPPLSTEEFSTLEQLIVRDGCTNPLSIWRVGGENVLVDGHNRYKICEKLGKKFEIKQVEFEDRDYAKQWIINQQFGRRNLAPGVRAALVSDAARIEEAIKRKESAKIAAKVSHQPIADKGVSVRDKVPPTLKPPISKTYEAIAKEKNVPAREVRAFREIEATNKPLAAKVRIGEVSLADARREVKREVLIEKLESVEAVKAKEISGRYDVIVIDPPWPMEKIERDERPHQVKFDYPTMSLKEIAEDIGESLKKHAEADTHIFLWTTQKFLPNAFNLLEEWKLKYVCVFVWHKPGGFQPIGLPQYNAEFVIYARKGSPKFVDTKRFNTCFEAPRGKHSEKPEEFYELLRRVTAGRRLDMFNRREIEGFDGWGKESS